MGELFGFVLFFLSVMNISSSPYPLCLLLCYLVHETGHIFMAYLCKAEIRDFKMSLFRMKIRYDCTRLTYGRECLVCLGGVLFNFIFALIFSAPVFDFSDKICFFVMCNICLGLMNLYPVSILDGGNALRCFLMMCSDEIKASAISTCVSFVFAFILWLISIYLQLVFSSDVSIFFISVFLLTQLCFSVGERQ